jgi:hypothetical protein
VQYKVINNNTELWVKISDYPQQDSDNGIKYILSNAPLARLSFGKTIGQIITFNNNQFEILDII